MNNLEDYCKILSYKAVSIVFISFLMFSCGSSELQDDSRVLVEAGGSVLTQNQLRDRMPVWTTPADSAYFAQSIINQWITRQVLAQKALELDLDNSQTFLSRYNDLKNELLGELLKDYVMISQEDISVSRDEIMQFYNQHRSSIVLNERHLQFHHMITETLEDAEKARSEIFTGLDWEGIATRYSVDPDYSIANSRVFHPESNVLQDLPIKQQFARLIGITEVSPTRLIDGKYHFIQLIDDRATGDIPDLEWALKLVEEWLLIDKRQQFFNTYKRILLREATEKGSVQTFY